MTEWAQNEAMDWREKAMPTTYVKNASVHRTRKTRISRVWLLEPVSPCRALREFP